MQAFTLSTASPLALRLRNTRCFPTRSSIAGAGNAEAWEKTFTLASRCLLFLSHVPTQQQQILPGVPYCSQDTWKKNRGGSRGKGMLQGSSFRAGADASHPLSWNQMKLLWRKRGFFHS